MSAIKMEVYIELAYSGDEQQAIADAAELIEDMPADYTGPVERITVEGSIVG